MRGIINFELPKSIVSNRGPPFNSSAFIKFCGNGIIVLKSSYQSKSNGNVTAALQSFDEIDETKYKL